MQAAPPKQYGQVDVFQGIPGTEILAKASQDEGDEADEGSFPIDFGSCREH